MSYIRQQTAPPVSVTADNIGSMKLPTDLTGLLTWHVLALCAMLALGFVIGRVTAAQKLLDARAILDVCVIYMPGIVDTVLKATTPTPRKPRLRPWLKAAVARVKLALAPTPAPVTLRVKTVPTGDRKPALRDRFTVPPNMRNHLSRERLLTAPAPTVKLPRFRDRIFMLDLTGTKPRGHLIPV